MKSQNPFYNTNLGVTNTINTSSIVLPDCQTMLVILYLLYQSFMSVCNNCNRTTTIVVPPCMQNASNINNKLFLELVPITTNIRLLPQKMAVIAFLYSLQNWLRSPIYALNSYQTFTYYINYCCQICICCITSLYNDQVSLTLPNLPTLLPVNRNFKNQCHSWLIT